MPGMVRDLVHTIQLHCVTSSATGTRYSGVDCEDELQETQLDIVHADQLVEQAIELLSEALVRIDAVMAHQAGALVDHAINILAGWTCNGEEVVSTPH